MIDEDWTEACWRENEAIDEPDQETDRRFSRSTEQVLDCNTVRHTHTVRHTVRQWAQIFLKFRDAVDLLQGKIERGNVSQTCRKQQSGDRIFL